MRKALACKTLLFALPLLLALPLPATPSPAMNGSAARPPGAGTPAGYEELLALFARWRAVREPPVVNGVPDYGEEAMRRQLRALAQIRERLEAIDPGDWPVGQRVDYEIVRAEMNGLYFDLTVRRPWARDPAFYASVFGSQSDTPAHEGPVIHGFIDLWRYGDPLTAAAAEELAGRLRAVPPLLQQARTNLTGDGHDLWQAAIRSFARQEQDLAVFADRVAGISPHLDEALAAARAATGRFRAWLETEAPRKSGHSGIGRDNYTWNLQHVHLIPYTWEQEVTIVQRELVRAHAALRLEEHRNRELPPLEPIASAQEYDRRLNEAVTEYMRFLEQEEIVSVRPTMDAALRARIGSFRPPVNGRRPFFSEVNVREPIVMRTHGYHWFDLARMQQEPHRSPIRREPLPYNIWDARSEGLATAVEEMLMHAGLLDESPRARELIWILLAQRAARALAALMMHANEFTMDEAIEFASAWTPRGWMPADGELVRGEQQLYLRQPGYGTSYVIGKIEIEQLLAERARQLGAEFTLRRFFDEVNAAGVIPVSLIRWQLTGHPPVNLTPVHRSSARNMLPVWVPRQ